MRIADFLVMLLPSKRGIGVTKRSRMNALFKDLTFQIGLFVEVNPLKTPWETICHLNLGVLKGTSTKSRRIDGGFKHALCTAARNSRGKGVKRPGQILCGLQASKRGKAASSLSHSSGYRSELFLIWNYWLACRIHK